VTFEREDRGPETLLSIEGSLDAVTTPDLRPCLEALIADQRRKVVVDLSALELIDSSGVGAIVALFKRVRAVGGTVRVVGLRDQPLAIFRLLHLDRIFGI
jgi:anti-sigma B factor antagonist